MGSGRGGAETVVTRGASLGNGGGADETTTIAERLDATRVSHWLDRRESSLHSKETSRIEIFG